MGAVYLFFFVLHDNKIVSSFFFLVGEGRGERREIVVVDVDIEGCFILYYLHNLYAEKRHIIYIFVLFIHTEKSDRFVYFIRFVFPFVAMW